MAFKQMQTKGIETSWIKNINFYRLRDYWAGSTINNIFHPDILLIIIYNYSLSRKYVQQERLIAIIVLYFIRFGSKMNPVTSATGRRIIYKGTMGNPLNLHVKIHPPLPFNTLDNTQSDSEALTDSGYFVNDNNF